MAAKRAGPAPYTVRARVGSRRERRRIPKGSGCAASPLIENPT
jgi:hypothetical protein